MKYAHEFVRIYFIFLWQTNSFCIHIIHLLIFIGIYCFSGTCWAVGWLLPFNSLRPRQNGRLFADDTFKRIFLNENIRISTKNSLKFVPKGLINNIPALVLIMAWRRPGDKPLSELMLVRSLTHICVTRPQWVKYPLTHWWRDKMGNISQMTFSNAFSLIKMKWGGGGGGGGINYIDPLRIDWWYNQMCGVFCEFNFLSMFVPFCFKMRIPIESIKTTSIGKC